MRKSRRSKVGKLKECLRSILNEKKAPITSPDEKGLLTLSEDRGDDLQMKVEVRQVPSTTTAIRLPESTEHAILRQSRGALWLKSCDYLLVDEGERECRVAMIELKSDLHKDGRGLEQLRRTLPLAKYILSVCEVELQCSWCHRFNYVLIAEKSGRFDKQRARSHPQVETRDHEDIEVGVGVGTQFNFSSLMA